MNVHVHKSHAPAHTHTLSSPIISSMDVNLCVCPATSVALHNNNKMKTALSASSHSYKPNKVASSLSDDYNASVCFPLIRIAVLLRACWCVCVWPIYNLACRVFCWSSPAQSHYVPSVNEWWRLKFILRYCFRVWWITILCFLAASQSNRQEEICLRGAWY